MIMQNTLLYPGRFLASALTAAVLLVSAACSDGAVEPEADFVEDTIRFTAIAAGARHSCAIGADGGTYCWGYATDGQVGWGLQGRVTGASLVVSGGVHFLEISAGSQHSCGLDAEGLVYCWGRGPWGFAFVPDEIDGTGGMNSLSSTANHVCAVTSEATASCFGGGYGGQLGEGVSQEEQDSDESVVVPGVSGVVRVVTGKNFSCALTEGGEAWCWGLAEAGQLGIGDDAPLCEVAGSTEVPCSFAPARVEASGSYTDLAAGLYHACGLLTSGQVECWGDDVAAQLGLDDGAAETCTWVAEGPGTERACARTPAVISGGITFASIDGGFFHTCGISADADAYCWGSNSFGQIGSGGTQPGAGPELVAGEHKWAAIAAGQVHTCGITTSGAAYCWGDGTWGQLGSFRELSAHPRLVMR
jgi:alpha-tubulin suppressor-like RCC1 family protein